MKKQIFLGVLFILFFSACKQPDYTDFCDQADKFLTESNFQGTVLIARKNKIIFDKGYGPVDEKQKSSDENNSDTVFEIGSVTKQMTAACIMQLVEQKKLSLDDTLSDFFPDFEYGNEIKIRMLLNMRSGLTDHINSPDEFFPPKTFRQIQKKEWDNEEVDRDFVLKNLYSAPLLAKPDSTYFYCNTNYYLLALIIEEVSGKSYEDYLAENIFKKAKMISANTDFQRTTGKGYYKKHYYSIPKNMAIGCGDVNASAKDILNWNKAFTSGKIVSKKSFKSMIDSESYGYGVYVTENSILHSGSTHVFNSYNEFLFDDKISIIVLSNKPQLEQNSTIIAGRLKKILQGS